jgi:hypothetical protein
MSNNMTAISWRTGVGVNHVGAYQVSGRPFATGSCMASSSLRVDLPKISRWVQIINRDPLNSCQVGFSLHGVEGTEKNYFFTVPPPAPGGATSSEVYELKISQVHLKGAGTVDVVAGLTNIDTGSLVTSLGGNWSGSVGVG